MRIGLYGMPTAGKSYILDKVDFLDVVAGSKFLREYDPNFDVQSEEVKDQDRKAIAKLLMRKDNFIMDGHYAFGNTTVFTDADGEMYDTFLYLYVDPELLRERMMNSPRNQKYLVYDLREWQNREISSLRAYCHNHCKDFYVIDNPPNNVSEDPNLVIRFLKNIVNGYSCSAYAKLCADAILRAESSEYIVLMDGDKTLVTKDTSKYLLGYTTNLFDGNFYTGYQVWKQELELKRLNIPTLEQMTFSLNDLVARNITASTYIVTSGHPNIWTKIAEELHLSLFAGNQMAAETKLYLTKYLQAAGKRVIAYGDGMNDYYMLRQADKGYLICKKDGTVSKSLIGMDLEGLNLVRAQ